MHFPRLIGVSSQHREAAQKTTSEGNPIELILNLVRIQRPARDPVAPKECRRCSRGLGGPSGRACALRGASNVAS